MHVQSGRQSSKTQFMLHVYSQTKDFTIVEFSKAPSHLNHQLHLFKLSKMQLMADW